MKTRSFATIKVDVEEDYCVLTVQSHGSFVQVPLEPDEVLLFLVEVSNGLTDSRAKELAKKIQREYEKEKRRGCG